jgi:hypothetical protein
MCLTEGEKINFLLKKEIKEEMKKKLSSMKIILSLEGRRTVSFQ